VAESGYLL
jgi:hypothetical protein